MTKFIFASQQNGETIYVDPKKGTLDLPNHAEVEYAIDREDSDVRLTINEYYFDVPSLDTLIEFLKAVREEIA